MWLNQFLNSPPHPSIEDAARELQKKFLAERASIFILDKNKIVVTISLRTPIMLVETDKIRYLTKSGAIYGEAEKPETENLPVLSGIFSQRETPFQFLPDNSLELREDEKTLVSEAIQLLNISRNKGFDLIKIGYIIYRGFSMILEENQTEIIIGRSPFSTSIDRLGHILIKLKEKGSIAARIELDYNGKAFIKEKNL
ncbi:MAG: hypothetical protein HQK54_01015 [Oligoflexales bacterium]|nr:hypothetical protein [Oligoflexales bacterium]